MDKDKIQNIAEELADSMYGKDFYDLSGRQQSEIYSKAIRELNDMLADKADMMRKNEADGGIIRAGFANGTMMASAPDPMDERNSVMENIAMEEFGRPLSDLTEDEIIQIEMMMEEMSMNKRRAPSIKMASMDDDYEQEFMKLVGEFMEQGFSQQEAIEEAKDTLERQAIATGGRVGLQTGGITESRTLPPEFVEAAQKTYLTDLSRQAGIPSITTATTQQPGETAEQFANRKAQAEQFGIRRAGMAELAPQVAAQDPYQAAAYAQATDPSTGLGSFQPFLTKAGAAADAGTALTGTGAGTGAGSIQSYMSPFQQQVIDATLQDFDKQAKIRENQLAAQTLGVPGAFGGGREGVQRAQYQAASDQNRAQTLAGLRQTGFQNAANRRQQDLANQMGIANLQQGLGGAAQDFSRAQISGLGTLGSAQQTQNQAILDAQRQAAQMAVQDPRDRLGMYGQGIAQITPGAGAVRLDPTAATAPSASPLAQALGYGLAGADIYGRIFGGKG